MCQQVDVFFCFFFRHEIVRGLRFHDFGDGQQIVFGSGILLAPFQPVSVHGVMGMRQGGSGETRALTPHTSVKYGGYCNNAS